MVQLVQQARIATFEDLQQFASLSCITSIRLRVTFVQITTGINQISNLYGLRRCGNGCKVLSIERESSGSVSVTRTTDASQLADNLSHG